MEPKETVEINEENIQKALNFLKLDINPFANKMNNLEKAIEEEEKKPEVEEKKEPGEKLEEKKEEKIEDPEEKPEEKLEKTKIKKSIEDFADVLKPFEDTLQKAIMDKVETLEKSILEKLEETTIELKNSKELNQNLTTQLEEINKAIESGFNVLVDKFKSVGELEQRHLQAIGLQNEKIEKFLKTPIEKSITSKNYMEKGFDKDEINKGTSEKRLSLSKNRKEVISLLRQKSKIDEVDDIKKAVGPYLSALQEFEASNKLSKAIQQDILKSEQIEIIS
jgi:hypothetical protein